MSTDVSVKTLQDRVQTISEESEHLKMGNKSFGEAQCRYDKEIKRWNPRSWKAL